MALRIYLFSLHDILYGPASMDNPVQVISTAYAIYASLHYCYVYYDNHEADWKFDETIEVC